MPPDPSLPPILPAALPPVIPTPPAGHSPKPGKAGGRSLLAGLLSVGLVLFLVDAGFSLADDLLILFTGTHWLSGLRTVAGLLSFPLWLFIYVLMGLTRQVPKRAFLPLALFPLVALLALGPAAIYQFRHLPVIMCVLSALQMALGLAVLGYCRGGAVAAWPVVALSRLRPAGFSWFNLAGWLAFTFLLLPLVLAAYTAVCAGLAIDHFSDGFVALRPGGLTVQVRQYTRPDGKSIRLVPMAHVGEFAFYRSLAESFPTNAIVLMEGVSDKKDLLTNTVKISYGRMAKSFGVAEQHDAFHPRGEIIRADVDVAEFSRETIDFINLAMNFHTHGFDPAMLRQLIAQPQPENVEKQVLADILELRNRHLLGEIKSRLGDPGEIIVPWGAAHMPELGRELLKLGFRITETTRYTAISFEHPKRAYSPAHDPAKSGG